MREDLVKRERVKKESIDHPRRASKEEVRRPLGNPSSSPHPHPPPVLVNVLQARVGLTQPRKLNAKKWRMTEAKQNSPKALGATAKRKTDQDSAFRLTTLRTTLFEAE